MASGSRAHLRACTPAAPQLPFPRLASLVPRQPALHPALHPTPPSLQAPRQRLRAGNKRPGHALHGGVLVGAFGGTHGGVEPRRVWGGPAARHRGGLLLVRPGGGAVRPRAGRRHVRRRLLLLRPLLPLSVGAACRAAAAQLPLCVPLHLLPGPALACCNGLITLSAGVSVVAVLLPCCRCLCKLLDGIQDHYTYAQPGIQRALFHTQELVRCGSRAHALVATGAWHGAGKEGTARARRPARRCSKHSHQSRWSGLRPWRGRSAAVPHAAPVCLAPRRSSPLLQARGGAGGSAP